MTIDSLANDCFLLTYIKNLGLKYYVRQHVKDQNEVSVVLPNSLIKTILEKAISEDTENIFMIDIHGQTKVDDFSLRSFESLVTTGIASVFISISFDENALFISVNKTLTQPHMLYRRIKALRFDKI